MDSPVGPQWSPFSAGLEALHGGGFCACRYLTCQFVIGQVFGLKGQLQRSEKSLGCFGFACGR